MVFGLIILLVLTFSFFLFRKWLDGIMPLWYVFVAWGIKLIAVIAFYYTYTYIYGKGELSQDAGSFIQEAQLLNIIKQTSIEDYRVIFLQQEGANAKIADYFKKIPDSRFSRQDDFLNETRNFIKLLSLILALSNNNSIVAQILLLYISLLAGLYLFKAIQFRKQIAGYYFFLLLMPSLLFWTSSPLKESIMIPGLFLVFGGLISMKRNWVDIILILLGFLFLSTTKSYILFSAFGIFLFYLLVLKIRTNKFKSLWMVSSVLVVVITLAIFQNKAIQQLTLKQRDFQNVANGGIHLKNDTTYFYLPYEKRNIIVSIGSSDSVKLSQYVIASVVPFVLKKTDGTKLLRAEKDHFHLAYCSPKSNSGFKILDLNFSWLRFVTYSPVAIYNALLKPNPITEPWNLSNLFLFIESIVLVFMLVQAVRLFQEKSFESKTMLLSFFLFATFLAVLIGTLTPIVGAIVRYRIPIHLSIIIVYLLTLKSKAIDV